MSVLFAPLQIGSLAVRNRFIHSACEDNMATDSGEITDRVVRRLQRLSRSEVGLIISSHLAVHSSGRTRKYQAAIFTDGLVEGLRRAVDAVHGEGGKIAFQIGHGGLQSSQETSGQDLMSPVSLRGDEIQKIIDTFRTAAERAVRAAAWSVIFVVWSNLFLLIRGKGGPTEGLGVAVSPKTSKLVRSARIALREIPWFSACFPCTLP